jgi:uncharacterized protein YbbC (DUF1343 family)
MFSFRTTSLENQLDKALLDGKVGCFCTQNCWDTASRKYMYELFQERGNLKALFTPRDAELSPETNHILFNIEDLKGLDAIVVEIQDAGARYFNYSKDVFALMEALNTLDAPPALYIVDHINPAGRIVEGSMPSGKTEQHIPKVAHRHGMTLGELCNIYYSEIGGKFALHVISARANDSTRQILPWTIAPASDIPGMFTCYMYSGGGLWNNTSISPGIGTARPYEYFGAPFIHHSSLDILPAPAGVLMRPCSFTPATGRYEGQKCYGYQIMLQPGAEYHSLLHTLQIMRYFLERYPQFELFSEFEAKLADPVMMEYLQGKISFQDLREHVKVEEQRWIRKAKRYSLYEDDQPYRIK